MVTCRGLGGGSPGLETPPPAHRSAQLWAEPAHHMRLSSRFTLREGLSIELLGNVSIPTSSHTSPPQCHTRRLCAALGPHFSVSTCSSSPSSSLLWNLPGLVSFSHRSKGAEITCPISLRKRTRIRTRRVTFLSSCPCWRTEPPPHSHNHSHGAELCSEGNQ